MWKYCVLWNLSLLWLAYGVNTHDQRGLFCPEMWILKHCVWRCPNSPRTDRHLPTFIILLFKTCVLFPCHGSSKPEVSLQRWDWYQRGTDVTCVFQSRGVVAFPSTVGIAGDGIEANQDNIRFILKNWRAWISSWFFRSFWSKRPSMHQANLTPKKESCILQAVLDFVLLLRML